MRKTLRDSTPLSATKKKGFIRFSLVRRFRRRCRCNRRRRLGHPTSSPGPERPAPRARSGWSCPLAGGFDFVAAQKNLKLLFSNKNRFDDKFYNWRSLWLDSAGNANWGGRLSTADLLIKVDCFIKKIHNLFNIERNWSKLVIQGGQLYWAFPFSKTSLDSVMSMCHLGI